MDESVLTNSLDLNEPCAFELFDMMGQSRGTDGEMLPKLRQGHPLFGSKFPEDDLSALACQTTRNGPNLFTRNLSPLVVRMFR